MTSGAVLVVGASGQLACCLRDLVGASPFPIIFAGRARLDLCASEEDVRRVVDEVAPVAIINAAAYTAVDKAESDEAAAYRVNVTGVAALAAASARRAVPFIHVSTDYVFSGDKDGAYDETDPVAPLGVYGLTKAKGEAAFAATGCFGSVVRTSWVYSHHGANFVKTMLRLAATRDEVRVVADQWGRPTHASDLARACLVLAERWIEGRPTPPLLHYAGGGEAVWADVAEETFAAQAEFGGKSVRVARITTAEYGATIARRPLNSRLSTARIEALGVETPPWRARVRDCVRACLSMGYLESGI